MKRYSITILLVILVVANLAFLADAVTQEVCGCLCSCEFKSIQTAVYGAHKGDVIKIAAGEYNENLVIDKSITLEGPTLKQAVVESLDPKQPAIIVGPSDVTVTIRRLVVTRRSSSKPKSMSVQEFSAGIMVIGKGEVKLENTVIKLNN